MAQGQKMMTQATIIDADYHVTLAIGANNVGRTSSPDLLRNLWILEPAKKAYQAAHGEIPRDLQLLLSYATTPEQLAALEWIKAFDAKERAAQEATRARAKKKAP